MKRLILLRHAKAVPASGGNDHDRDLAPRGLEEAAWAGVSIAATGWAPEIALVSDARRTIQTFETVAARLDPVPRLLHEPRLYDASPDDILAAIAGTAPEIRCILVVGHNPGLALTAARLSHAGDPEARSRLARGLPTSAFVLIALDGTVWADAALGGTLEAMMAPS